MQGATSQRMLLLTLTDGKTNVKALEMKVVKKLGLDTPPGTKVLVENVRSSCFSFLLSPSFSHFFLQNRKGGLDVR